MPSPSRIIAVAIVIVFCLGAAVQAQNEKEVTTLDWLEGFTLVELDSDDVASLHAARSLIESSGGQIAIISPPSLLLGWVPFERREDLIGRAHIKNIFYTDVLPGEVAIKDEQTRHMVTYFNRVSRGEYQEDWVKWQMATPPLDEMIIRPDAWKHEPLDDEAYQDNLRDNGFDVQELRDRGILLERSTLESMGNSDYMTGTVATTLIFVESDGSGSDPNSYTWTTQHVQNWIAGVNTGLAWWSAAARNHDSCWVAFFVRYYVPTDPRCQNWREMVLHPSSDVSLMVAGVMSKFGYISGDHFTKVNSFNTAMRATYGTDWSYTGFIAYNPSPAPNQLTDGKAAFAYRGGPYNFCLYRSYGWAPEQVFAHETGHIFWACDEYEGSCACNASCSNGVLNGNCVLCPTTVNCMMKANSFSLCSYTDGHVGWEITPCAPTPLAAPVVSAVSPDAGIQGQEITVTIVGGNYLFGAFAGMGDGITITSTELLSADSLRLAISIGDAATPGARDVVVKNRDMQAGTLVGGFDVLASTRHYVSTTGGSVSPYLSPSEAATSVANALAVAATGDSILVESATFSVASLNIVTGVTLSGAWTDGFTNRDVVSAKTTLDLGSNVLVGSGGAEAVIEGFILQNGNGTSNMTPRTGYYGGAFKVINSTARISHCEMRQNAATSSSFGGGGGVFASGSTVTIENCYIHDNSATYGGGVYLYNSDGTLTGNTIAENTVSLSTLQPFGGGVAIESCTGVALDGNTIDGNTGSDEGGGIWIETSDDVSLTGGEVSNNAAAVTGGGALVSHSYVTLQGVTFSRNASASGGGGATVEDTSSVTVTGCRFLWNTGRTGAGLRVYESGGEIRHNLFVGNQSTSSGSALYVGYVTEGAVVGNTIDRNVAPTNRGSMTLVNSPVEVYNNIVTNATGYGIYCTGTLPVLSYNDVWNSSAGNYYGGTAGVGSISDDAVYVDTALVDYHLGVHSPAIDAGRPGTAYGDPDGSPGDMGIYGSHAFTMDQPSYVKDLEAESAAGGLTLRWQRNPEADMARYAVYCDTLSGFKPSIANFVQFVVAPDTTVTFSAPGDTAYYRVSAVDSDDYAGGYSFEATASPPTGVGDERLVFANLLYQNIPNPFNPTTIIRFEISERSDVSLTVYDVGGRLVRRLMEQTLPAGLHAAIWDGSSDDGTRVSSGIYFYKLEAGGFTQTRKMVMLK